MSSVGLVNLDARAFVGMHGLLDNAIIQLTWLNYLKLKGTRHLVPNNVIH